MSGLMRKDLYAELYQVENNHWWHQHKRATVQQMISQMKPGKASLAESRRALDIGCGTGKIMEELNCLGWKFEGVDRSALAKKEGQKRSLKITVTDAMVRLPFANKSFQLVLALDFLEHVKNANKVVKEIHRVLKSNGTMIVSVPAYQKLFSYWDKMLGHYRRYSKNDLAKLVTQSGFDVKFISYYFSWLLLPAIMIRMIKKTLKFKTSSDFQANTDNFVIVNIIKLLSRTELWLLKYIKIPFGLSLICVATPKNSRL